MVLVLCEVRKIVVFLFEVSQIPGTIVEVNKIKVYRLKKKMNLVFSQILVCHRSPFLIRSILLCDVNQVSLNWYKTCHFKPIR